MMYLLFLAIVYAIEGGYFTSFILSALGIDVDEDKTPEHPSTCRPPPAAGDGAGVTRDDLHTEVEFVGLPDAGTPLRKSAPNVISEERVGGTFSGEYQPLVGYEKEENASELETPASVTRAFSTLSGVSGGVGDRRVSFDLGDGLRTTAEDNVNITDRWFLSVEDKKTLKRRTVMSRITPLLLLSSFVSDLDLVTDWCFYYFELAGKSTAIRDTGLAFTIVGTIMWAMTSTEFGLLSLLKTIWRGNPLSRLEFVSLGWQLLANVFLEDLPQFVITIITRPTSVAGVLNLTASGFSLASKMLQGFTSQRAPSLSTQFKMIDLDPAVTRNLFKLSDEAKAKAKAAEKLVYLAWTNRCSKDEKKAATVFEVMQIDPTFVNGDLDYMKPDLTHSHRLYITGCHLKGHIPKELGAYSFVKDIILRDNELSGTIPTQLTKLESLMELDLSNNMLTGLIPPELGRLSLLHTLHLQKNELSGPIPSALGQLRSLKSLLLANNRLTGEIPVELAELEQLDKLDLSRNRLEGHIPKELGKLTNLEDLNLGKNKLIGRVPESLGDLEQLRYLRVDGNMLVDAKETEDTLRQLLHPDCITDFMPQRKLEGKEWDPEEGTD